MDSDEEDTGGAAAAGCDHEDDGDDNASTAEQLMGMARCGFDEGQSPLVNALMLAKWTNFLGESEVATAFN